MYKIIQKRKIWLTISGVLTGISIILLIAFGLNLGIDFTGGSLLEVKFYGERPSFEEVQEAIGELDLGNSTIQPVANDGMILRFQDITEEKHQEVIKKLNNLVAEVEEDSGDTEEAPLLEVNDNSIGDIEIETGSGEIISSGSLEDKTGVLELRFDAVGPSIGEELKRKSIYAIIFVLIAIILYIAWAFRKVSKPVASWKYGLAAIAALFHDVLITVGVFVILGKYFGVEVNAPFIVALLTVLGYSVNDSIVVFDRIRENLPKSDEDFENTINTSVNQTITRSINTSLTTLIVLLSIVFFGGATIKSFALALSIGIFIGTYSSIFLASPLLVVWEKFRSRD